MERIPGSGYLQVDRISDSENEQPSPCGSTSSIQVCCVVLDEYIGLFLYCIVQNEGMYWSRVLCVIPLVNTCPDKQHDTVISYLVFLGLKKNKAK